MSTRVVLLGASNVAIGLPSIVRQIVAGLPRPLEIFAAFGHGRSYRAWSRVLFRGLPGIDGCGLWADLERTAVEGSSRTLALMTDIGNDLIYGCDAGAVAAPIEACLARLVAHRAEIVITRLPLASIERLSALRFHATKALFFPRTKGTWPAMLAQAHNLNLALGGLADRTAARLIEQPLDWYGFDPIHIRRGRREEAWRTVFSGWPSFRSDAPATRLSWKHVMQMRFAAPAERRLFGRSQRRMQPATRMGDVALRLY